MRLPKEDREKLEKAAIANALRKLEAGKTLTRKERKLLADAANVPIPSSAFAATWDTLAVALGVNRRTINLWRSDPRYRDDCPPCKADGRKEVALWFEFMRRNGLGKDDPGAQHAEDDALHPPRLGGTPSDWRKAEIAVKVETRRAELDALRGTLIVSAELEGPLGALLSAIHNKMTTLPERVAPMVAGFTDIGEITDIIHAEVQLDMTDLHGCEYITDAKVYAETVELTLAAQDEASLRALIANGVIACLQSIGRRTIERATE